MVVFDHHVIGREDFNTCNIEGAELAAISDFKSSDINIGSRHGDDFAAVLPIQHRIANAEEGQGLVNGQIAFGIAALVDENGVAGLGFGQRQMDGGVKLVGTDMVIVADRWSADSSRTRNGNCLMVSILFLSW